MKKLLLLLALLSISTGRVIAADKEIGFTVTDPTRTHEVGRSGTYDYAPSVIEENGEKKVYVCGGGSSGDPYAGHDAIYLTVFNSNGVKTIDSRRVLSPLINNDKSDDSVHACAPTVVKHSFPLLAGGAEKYLMYYECAPKVYKKSDKVEIDTFTQICLAYSDDGVNWQKFNEKIFSSQYRFANENEPPTAVRTINPLMAQTFGIEKIDGKYWTNLNTFDINSYGVGHPTALVKDGKIWLYYYDSVGEWNNRGMYLAKSDDGFHFYPSVKIGNLRGPAEIKYVAVPILGRTGFFISFGGAFSIPYYNYSWDGITWAWNEIDSKAFYTDFLANNYSLGPSSPGKCLAPGTNTFVSDPFGTLHSLDVELFINEGYWGISDACTSSNGCMCYSPQENQGRGSTWQTYMYKGKFVPILPPTPTPTPKPGDLNGDGHVNIYDYNQLIANFGNPYTIFDYNTLVGNFGK